MTGTARRVAALGGIVAAWGLSLALPALAVRGGPTLSGFDLLIQGWQGASRGIVAWFANPAFVLAVAASAVRLHGTAGVLSGVSLVLALTSFAVADVASLRLSSVPDVELRVGFFLWLASLLALFLSSWTSVFLQRPRSLQP